MIKISYFIDINHNTKIIQLDHLINKVRLYKC